ncbi:MAG: glycosyltransferase, partial [Cyanobacteria bacterium J06648_11]
YTLLGSSVSDLYNQMLKRGWTWLWPLQMKLNKLLVKLNYQTGVEFFEGYWREQQPDLVLSVVTMCNQVLWDALERAQPGTPYLTLPIDFADYPPGFWFEPDTDSYAFCATTRALEQARALGVKEDRIVPTSGMAIHPRFYEPDPRDRRQERQRLGLDPDKLTGLVMFGGNGSRVMLDIAKRLERYSEDLQLAFLCGRDEQLARDISALGGKQVRAVVGFTRDMPYYMHLADFFIGKPGPGSLSEALAMNLPVVTTCNPSTLIHERYNAEWVRSRRVGIVLDSFRQVAGAVEQFLQPDLLEQYRANVAAIDNQAVFEVIDFVQHVLAERTARPACR